VSGFVVDSRTLVAVRDTLDRLHDQLLGMHTVIWHQGGTLGGHALESELEHFCDTWHYGVSELGGQLQDLTRRLGEAAAAYERIEKHIIEAGGGSGSGSRTGGAAVGPAGSGHTGTSAHHTTATHKGAAHHTAKHSAASYHSGPSAPGGIHYSGGAGLAPGPTGAGSAGHSGERHGGGDKHRGDQHPGVGSGTTVIPPGPTGGAHPGRHHPSNGSGSGTTVIGGGPTRSSGSGSASGTTTIDEKIHRSEERQRAELASVRHMVKD
jgi:hypothetical protein